MAANLQWKRAIGLGKRISDQLTGAGAVPGLATRRSPAVLSAALRGVHASVYDKNPDDHVHPAFVPDDVIQLQSARYWGPHPTTGVFGPADHDGRRPDPAVAASLGNGGCASVLDQKAWFRPLEDVEKPPFA